ncbi:MAG: molybdopterin molybdotransferase MoeA [Planctomycetota bacterium]|nr:molybdopterin molybdotransferase MoeA [Planctomycetota bacterium]
MAPLPDYPNALAQVLAGPWRTTSVESIELHRVSGRVLAEAILADRDLPPFNRSAMDGYALRSQDLLKTDTLPCVGFIAAGDADAPKVPAGSCVGIATGAAVPEGLDAVAPHEWTNRASPVLFNKSPASGDSIHPQGSDAKQGDELVSPGTTLGTVEQGLAATVGQLDVPVYQRPRVLLLSSGDEVVPVDSTPAPHQIRNSNLMMISELLTRMGADIIEQRWLPDDVDQTLQALTQTDADMTVTIGGISAGDRDAFRDAIDALKPTMLLQGSAIQPGRPIQIAACGDAGRERPLVSLPGNPVSALVTASLFAWPVLRMLQGMNPSLPWTTGKLGNQAHRHHSRRRFRPATRDAQGNLHVPHWHGSGDLAHAVATVGLVDIESGSAPVPNGQDVSWLPWP